MATDLVNVEDEENQEYEEKRRHIEAIANNNLWNYSRKGREAMSAQMTMLSTKTGMHARVPILCKGDNCPYADTCTLLTVDLAPVGEYCPQETTQIELRQAEYMKDFDIDTTSFTDKNLLSEIVYLDIMMERCKALMSKETTPVIEVTTNITENGREVIQPMVSKAWEAYEKFSKKRDTDYQLLMATRKDKSKTSSEAVVDPLTKIVNIIKDEETFTIEQRPDEFKD